MIKKTLYFSLTILFYIFLLSTKVEAKEYCHIYVNDILKETIELPFYFYESHKTTEMEASWPKTSYSISYKKIESSTQCESIKKTLPEYDPYNIIGTFTKYDYTNKLYTSLPDQEIYDNSKLSLSGSVIKGFSSIIDEEPPIISGYKDYYSSNIDSPINLTYILQNITAYDERDGNLSSSIIVEYNDYEENLNKLGTYPIILSVCDSSNNKTSITFYIEIKDLTPPTIEGKQSYISHLSSPLTIEEIKSNLTVTDNTDINLSSSLYVCDDTYTINKNKTGLYTVYFCVMDSFYNEASPYKTVIEVKDDIPPIINGIDYHTSYLSNPLSIDIILKSIYATDNGQNISSSIFVTNDKYTQYKNTIGEKKIIFQAKDESNNLSSPFIVTVNLIDDVKPEIYGLNLFNSYLSSPLSLTYLKQQLTVLDNYDGNISSSLTIIDDTYSPNINNKGTYYISFNATDSSNNTSENFKISITNIDDLSPTIIGPSSLKYSIDNKPTIDNILSEYTVVDNIDNNLTIEIIEDTYSSSFSTGTYYISLSAIDSQSNKSVPFTIKIEIVDLLLNLNEISISLPTSKNYTLDEINKIINFTQSYNIIQNTYSPNYNTEGNYIIEYQLEDNSIITINIFTYNDQKNNNETITINNEEKKETFLSKIKSFFINLFNKIKQLISKIFNLKVYLASPQLFSYPENQHLPQ